MNKLLWLLLFPLIMSAEIRIQGSTTLLPALKDAAGSYADATGTSVQVRGGGSSLGIAKLLEGKSDIAMVSRPFTEEEKTRLLIVPVAHDGVAFIVHRGNPRQALTKQEVVAIYSGKLTHWENGRQITVVDKHPGHGTKQVFDDYFQIDAFAPGCYQVGSNTEALLYVATDRNAVSYVSVGAANDAIDKGLPIRILTFDGHEPSMGALVANNYPIMRTLSIAVRTDADAEVHRFLDYLTGPEGRRYIEEHNYIPLQVKVTAR